MIEIYQRRDFDISITLRNKATEELVDITGQSFTLSLKLPNDATPALQIQKTVGDHVDDDGANGFVKIPLTNTNTDLLAADYQWDVLRTVPGTPVQVYTVLSYAKLGNIRVHPSIG